MHRQNQNRTMSRLGRDVTVVVVAQTKQDWLNQRGTVQRLQRLRFLIVCWLRSYHLEDFTKVVKGWRPNVGPTNVGQRGFGEASVYWLLGYVGRTVPPASAVGGRCGVDAVEFIFQKPKGAAMSQKAQRRIARQKEAVELGAGPAVVRKVLPVGFLLGTVVRRRGGAFWGAVARAAMAALVIAMVVGRELVKHDLSELC